MNLILVSGATGSQGNPVAHELLDGGFKIRVLARTPDKAADLAAKGAEVVQGDLGDPESLRRAFEGVDGAFMHVPFFSGSPTDGPTFARHFVEAAKAANVKLLVWNASGEIPPARSGNPAMDVRLDLRDLVASSGLPYVILQPTAYMENFLGPWTREELAAQGVFAYPTPLAVKMQWIATADVGKFARAAFERPDVAPLDLKIAGPERLDGEQIAARLTNALGRDVTFRAMPAAEFGEKLDRVFPGMGGGAAAAYEMAWQHPDMMSSNVDVDAALRVLPVRLTTLEQWARQHANAFEPAREPAPAR